MNFFRKNSSGAKRSPLKAPPLRYAGQSLDEEIQKIFSDKIDDYGFWIAFFLGFALFEWIRWYVAIPPQLAFFTLLAIFGGGYALLQIRVYKRKILKLRLGRDGERAVGQYLEELREKGYKLFHDICGDVAGKNFNIDHVLIGKGGTFTIETKTISKPASGQAEVHYDGEQLLVNGFVPDRDPIIEAKAQAQWLKDLIKDSTGKTFKVRPVVFYPGWFISKQPKGVEVWVLNPKSLPAFLEYENEILSTDDVSLAAYHLSRYIRECQKQA
jgi:hypothetical protein